MFTKNINSAINTCQAKPSQAKPSQAKPMKMVMVLCVLGMGIINCTAAMGNVTVMNGVCEAPYGKAAGRLSVIRETTMLFLWGNMEDNTGEAIYHLRIYSVSQSMRDTALSKGALLPNDGVNVPKIEMLDEYTGDRGYIGDIVNEKITAGLIVANDGYTMMEHAVMHENSFPVYPPDFSRVAQIINDMPDPTYTIDGGVTNYKALIPGEHSVTLKQLKYKVFSMDWAGIVEVAVVPKITKITCRTLATPTSAGF